MALRTIIFLLAVLTLGACGRVGPLEPPPPAPGEPPVQQEEEGEPQGDRNFLDKLI